MPRHIKERNIFSFELGFQKKRFGLRVVQIHCLVLLVELKNETTMKGDLRWNADHQNG